MSGHCRLNLVSVKMKRLRGKLRPPSAITHVRANTVSADCCRNLASYSLGRRSPRLSPRPIASMARRSVRHGITIYSRLLREGRCHCTDTLAILLIYQTRMMAMNVMIPDGGRKCCLKNERERSWRSWCCLGVGGRRTCAQDVGSLRLCLWGWRRKRTCCACFVRPVAMYSNATSSRYTAAAGWDTCI